MSVSGRDVARGLVIVDVGPEMSPKGAEVIRNFVAHNVEFDDLEEFLDRVAAYDRFRSRITFPIRDQRGRVLGFGARALSADTKPKYLNSPEGELYRKSNTLYGIDRARDAARLSGFKRATEALSFKRALLSLRGSECKTRVSRDGSSGPRS